MKSLLLIVSVFMGVSPGASASTVTKFIVESDRYGAGGPCSGAIVKFPGQSNSDSALMLTAGHCLKRGVFRNITRGSLTGLAAGYDYFRGGAELGRFSVDEIVFAENDRVDLALFRMRQSYSDLKNSGASPFRITGARAATGSAIQVPTAAGRGGYKVFRCNMQSRVHILREGRQNHFDTFRYSEGCQVFPGTSGAPVIVSGEIVGVNITYSTPDLNPCGANAPCEVDRDGATHFEPGRGYGQGLLLLLQCLGDQGEFDSSLPECQL